MGRWSHSLNQSLPTPSSSGCDSVDGAPNPRGAKPSAHNANEPPDASCSDPELDDLLPNQPFDVKANSDVPEGNNVLQVPHRMLNTGARCPGIGYGTGGEGKATPSEVYEAVRVAIDRGYRNFDVAPFYQDGLIEKVVGRAIRDSGVPRSEFFVATKIWPTFSRMPQASLSMSLQNLGMDYVDCLLLHWPIPLCPVPGDPYAMGERWDAAWDFTKTWVKMQQIPRAKARAIGVCNFTVNRLRLLLASPTTTVVPAILQVEGHPELPQKRLMRFCRQHAIQVFCFSPLAQGQVSNPIIQHVAQHYNVDSGQVALSWAIQRGTVPLPKSTNLSRICTNMSLVHLNAEAMEMLEQLAKYPRRIVNPRLFFGHDIFENNIDSEPDGGDEGVRRSAREDNDNDDNDDNAESNDNKTKAPGNGLSRAAASPNNVHSSIDGRSTGELRQVNGSSGRNGGDLAAEKPAKRKRTH